MAVYNFQHDNRRVIFTCGCFYILTAKHIRLFQKIRKLFNSDEYRIVVGVNSSETQHKMKGYPIIFTDDQRKLLLESVKFIDDVIIFYEEIPNKLISHIEPSYIIKGIDYINKNIPESSLSKNGVILLRVEDIYKVNTRDIVGKFKSL